ncbi:MAG: DUF3489 domain-containing protein [Brevundimonas sp.]|nr:MAG: DUF3489 domain-containing protein [Brevundimonas sp.]
MTKAKQQTATPVSEKGPSKLDRLIALLRQPDGATMPVMMEATQWQAHSVRGALAGSLRKKGHAVQSAAKDGVRTWRIVEAAQ